MEPGPGVNTTLNGTALPTRGGQLEIVENHDRRRYQAWGLVPDLDTD